MVRDALCGVIEMSDGFELLGSAANGSKALKLLLSKETDIAIVDFALPDMTGIDVIRKARESGLNTRYLLLTGSHMDPDERGNIATVAEGFLHKEAGGDALLEALTAIANGPALQTASAETETGGVMNAGELTNRERGVLREIARGHSVDVIATNLGISVSTVRKHRENIMAKLELNSTAQLVRAAMQIGQF
ncbi:MAG: response regulator transcription factor [Gammaproteobacteria bacterium]|nr:response regulator transcription factor [Gammaproteobacteria bacterium]